MSGKTLSNGTLSLRFMQNAHRAKLQAQVEAEQAKIRDDAEWSVSQEVRDAWGIGQSSDTTGDTVHESSYLPFIFQSSFGEASFSGSQSDGRPQVKGRRIFDARGKEVVAEESKPNEESGGQVQPEDKKPRSKFEKRPTSISGFQNTISTHKDGKKTRTKTAQMLIREDVSVRPPASMQDDDPQDTKSALIPRSAGFVKPVGVDDPVPPPLRKVPKRDREQDLDVDRAGLEGKKRKKRKEIASS